MAIFSGEVTIKVKFKDLQMAVGSGIPSCKNCGGILCRFRIRPTSIQLTAINMIKFKSTYEEGWRN